MSESPAIRVKSRNEQRQKGSYSFEDLEKESERTHIIIRCQAIIFAFSRFSALDFVA